MTSHSFIVNEIHQIRVYVVFYFLYIAFQTIERGTLSAILFTNIQVFLISSKSNFESITPFNVFSKNTPIMHAIYV